MKKGWMLRRIGIPLSVGVLFLGCGKPQDKATETPAPPAASAPPTESSQAEQSNVAPAPDAEQEQPAQSEQAAKT